MSYNKHDWTEHDAVAKSLRLKGSSGIYKTSSGVVVDLTATQPTREYFLMKIGLLSV